MTLVFDLPWRRPSPLARLDPRWKLAAFTLAALACTLLQQIPTALAAWALALALTLVGRLPAVWLAKRLALVVLVVGSFVVWLPFFPGTTDEVAYWGNLPFSLEATRRAAVLVMRTLALVTYLLVLWATTAETDLFKAAHALHVPGILVQLTALTYRYLFVLVDEFSRMRVALRLRGFQNRMSRHGYRTIGQVAGSLLVNSHDRSERVAQAMRCRGFDGCYRNLRDYQTRLADLLGAGLLVLAAGVLLALDRGM